MSSYDTNQTAEYSPDRFYTHSTDRRGHSTTVRADVPPSILTQIAELVASRQIPEYKTTRDFIRDAVFHRAHQVAEMVKNGELERRVTIEAALDIANAYRQDEENETKLARVFDERLTENRSSYTNEYVLSHVHLAVTDRGRDELSRVYRRFF